MTSRTFYSAIRLAERLGVSMTDMSSLRGSDWLPMKRGRDFVVSKDAGLLVLRNLRLSSTALSDDEWASCAVDLERVQAAQVQQLQKALHGLSDAILRTQAVLEAMSLEPETR